MMNKQIIRERLVAHGAKLFKSPREFIRFTKDNDANKLLNNIEEHPHAFILACVMNRQIKAERAWLIPYRFQEKLGDFSIETLLTQSQEDIHKLMAEPKSLHRFVDKMAGFFFLAVQRIDGNYGGNASLIWKDTPSSATVVYRFLEFDGVGPKIASMAANILAREFKIPFADYFSIDISADIHVRRVFGRLGLTPLDATVEQLIFRARALHPEFPGMMDYPAWEIGRNWCKSRKPYCSNCYMNDMCPNATYERKNSGQPAASPDTRSRGTLENS